MSEVNYQEMEINELISLLNEKGKESDQLKLENMIKPSPFNTGRQVQILTEAAEIYEVTGYKMLEMADALRGNIRRS